MAGGRASQPSPEPPRPRWPSGFVGMLGLMLAVEIALTRAEIDLAPLAAADWGRNRAEAAREGAGADILCFGDSLIKTGVVPAVLEARLDRSAFNLACLGAAPPASYILLRRALEAGARPRAIVVDAGATTLNAADFRRFARDWSVLAGPGDALRLGRDDRNPDFFPTYLAHYLLPCVRLRLDLREAVVGRLARAEGGPGISWGAIVARQHAVNRGGIYRAPSHAKAGPDLYPDGVVPADSAAVCYPPGWTPYATNLVYLDRFLALAASRSIPVFFVVPPIHAGVQAGRERRGLDAAYMDLVRKLHARYPDVTVVDGRHAGYPHGVFADSHHLDLEGAAAFSEALAGVIARRLDGGEAARWVELPTYADPASWPMIEDMDQSRLALARQAARR